MIGPHPSPARPRLLACLVLALATCAVPASSAAAAAPRVIGSYVYFHPSSDDRDIVGTAEIVIRTDKALPVDANGYTKVGLYTISASEHCYATNRYVFRKGRNRKGRVGDRVRFRLGRRGSLLDRRFTVRKQRAKLPRGAALGCTRDPKARTVFFGLFREPQVEPPDIFFTANSGPYLTEISWSGWGTRQASATGVYVSDCASCGPPETYPVTITAQRTRACPGYAARRYTRLRWTRSDAPGKTNTLRSETPEFCA